ncbi:MAG: DUF255 domain-containing protein [Puia sp.]|nr:DUF255 domain-containing protein [Puia sp.]
MQLKQLATVLFLFAHILTQVKKSSDEDNDKGIRFEKGLTWHQIQDKAKAENKFIFMDCFATWCAPCKYMDKSVYTDDSIGNFINERFISVKVQLDSSAHDDDDIRKWYGDAHQIKENYFVSAMPTFLFFTPDGKMMFKEMGAKNVQDFRSMAALAMTDPNQEFYSLVEKYDENKVDYSRMPSLAEAAQNLHEDKLALNIARNYMHNYLDSLSARQFFTRQNFEFISIFYSMVNSGDKVFNYFIHQPAKVDNMMDDKGYSYRYAKYVIYKEEITPKLEKANEEGTAPNWDEIAGIIESKYGKKYVAPNLIDGKAAWFHSKADWKKYATYLVKQVELSGVRTLKKELSSIIYLNNSAFDVFKYSDDKVELKTALSWVNIAIPMDPKPSEVMLDTKANLLYKIGDRQAAMAVEKSALQLFPSSKSIRECYERMVKGEPTWTLEQ